MDEGVQADAYYGSWKFDGIHLLQLIGVSYPARRNEVVNSHDGLAVLQHPLDYTHELLRALLLFLGLSADHAMSGVVLKKAEGNLVECGLDRGDLGDDVNAVAVVFDHSLDAPDLSLDPSEALLESFLVGCVAVGVSRTSQFGFLSRFGPTRIPPSEVQLR